MFFWLFDAPMGYHQLAVAPTSQEKLAFQGPDAIKWTYCVMPFGPTNGPATFINFIHDVDSQWKALAANSGLVIDDDTNTKIIVDDIFSWGKTWTRHCYTSNANFECANPTDCHSASAKVISFPNASNLLGLTFIWMEIVLLCQSISFLSPGPNLRSSVMSPNLVVLCSFTANSFLSLSFEWHHYATSPRSLNTRTLSVHTGLTYHKQPLRT